MKKFFIYTFLLILSSYFLVNTLRILFHLYDVEKKMVFSKTELKKIEDQNKKLKDQLSETQSNYFVEKEGRDKLLLKKPNEEVFVVKPPASTQDENQEAPNLPIWKKWFDLLSS